jgi:hypothetical protein
MSWSPPNINNLCEQLPNELFDHIADYTTTVFEPITTVSMRSSVAMDPSIPPADGSCPFVGLPCELRRAIFGHVLPLKKMKDKIVEPYQKSAKSEATPDVRSRRAAEAEGQIRPQPPADPLRRAFEHAMASPPLAEHFQLLATQLLDPWNHSDRAHPARLT